MWIIFHSLFLTLWWWTYYKDIEDVEVEDTTDVVAEDSTDVVVAEDSTDVLYDTTTEITASLFGKSATSSSTSTPETVSEGLVAIPTTATDTFIPPDLSTLEDLPAVLPRTIVTNTDSTTGSSTVASTGNKVEGLPVVYASH